MPRLGRTRAVVTFLAEASAPLVPDVRPEWPEVVELDAHLTSDGGAVTRLRFPSAVAVHEVLGRLGVDAGSPATAAHGGLVVGGDDGPDAQVPPDVLRGGAPSGHESAGHRSTGRRRRARSGRRSTRVSSTRPASDATRRVPWSTCPPGR